jgi:hypothetical protein
MVFPGNMKATSSVQADPSSTNGQFTHGLLNPDAPVPESIRGGSPRRYGVYRNNVVIGLARALEANFPVLRRLLGEAYFAGFAREFVQVHPPRSPLMFEYGADMSTVLAATADLNDFPYLADIARLEQQVRISYHEADVPGLSPQDLSQLSGDALASAVFTAHPAMAVIESDYAIHTIYRANRDDDASPVSNVREPQAVLVTRPGLNVELHRLTLAQGKFFKSLAAGMPFGEAADEAFAVSEDFDLTPTLGLMLSTHAFQSITAAKD